MACFIIPLTQAVATTVFRHTHKSSAPSAFERQLPRLETMLYGGSAMLIVDHILSGEVVPYYPFFSALGQAGGATAMLREMLTVGVPMSVVVTCIWALWVALAARKKA